MITELQKSQKGKVLFSFFDGRKFVSDFGDFWAMFGEITEN